MQHGLGRVTKEVTVLLLAAGWLLIGAGLAGLSAGTPVYVGLVVLTGAAYLLRGRAPDPGVILGHDLGEYLRDAWAAPAIATATVLVTFGAGPGELQTLGGLVGLAGMCNYFLRPVYFGAYGVATSVVGIAEPENG